MLFLSTVQFGITLRISDDSVLYLSDVFTTMTDYESDIEMIVDGQLNTHKVDKVTQCLALVRHSVEAFFELVGEIEFF